MDNSRTSNIILVLEAILLVILLFIAIPKLVESISKKVDPAAQNNTVINNMSELEKSISKDDAAVLVARLGELVQSTPGYVNGAYTASKVEQKGSGFLVALTPVNGGRTVYVYIESDGFNESGIYINGLLKNAAYVPNIQQIQSDKVDEPNTIEGYKVYSGNETDQSQVPAADR